MKKSFTLSEVLIALTIIGIIAAITLPIAINKYKEQETVSKVKKFYSTFSNALNQAIANNGTVDIWDLEAKSGDYDSYSAKKFAEYIKPYLNIIYDCGTDSTNECMDNTTYKYLNGQEWSAYGSSSMYYKMILNDGSLVWFRTHINGCGQEDDDTNVCAQIWFDINGKKSPNQLGKDTFFAKVRPYNLGYSYQDTYTDCNLSGTGFSCLKYIIEYSDMSYLGKK